LHDLIILPASLVDRNFTNQKNQFLFTTPGKLIFNQILPASFPFYLNSLSDYNQQGERYQAMVSTVNELESQWQNYLSQSG
jgi:DNA-directed RNA polymerase subunit beta'